MTPKEKANRICLYYSNELKDYGNITNKVKRCALICINETIYALNKCYNDYLDVSHQKSYWLEVKEEVNKL